MSEAAAGAQNSTKAPNESLLKVVFGRNVYRHMAVGGGLLFAGWALAPFVALQLHAWQHGEEVEGRYARLRKENMPWQWYALSRLPLRQWSRQWGHLVHSKVPKPLREPLYKSFAWVYHIDLDEVPDPLDSYASLGEFFERPIDPSLRPVSQADIVSPVDGRVLAYGRIDRDDRDFVKHVKDVTFSVRQLLGKNPSLQNKRRAQTALHYAVLYLAPGDYHRMHAPCDMVVHQRRHFPGTLFPVHPRCLSVVPGLLAVNERVVLEGEWAWGHMSYIPVAAHNVGDIALSPLVDNCRTNLPEHDEDAWAASAHPHCSPDERYARWVKKNETPYGAHKGGYFNRFAPMSVGINKGEEVGTFRLGSTVVLLFEASTHEEHAWEWLKAEGDKIKVGESLGMHLTPAMRQRRQALQQAARTHAESQQQCSPLEAEQLRQLWEIQDLDEEPNALTEPDTLDSEEQRTE